MAQIINMTNQSVWQNAAAAGVAQATQSAITKAQNIQLQQNSYRIAVFIANLIAKLDEKINEANKFKLGTQERKAAFEIVHVYQEILDMAMKDLEVVKYDYTNKQNKNLFGG